MFDLERLFVFASLGYSKVLSPFEDDLLSVFNQF